MAAVITMWTAISPDVLSAQTSGVGCDGFTRFLWRGTNSEISLWRVDGNLNNPISHVYGPYDGWVPVAMTVLCNNYTYVLWKYTDGSISLWKVDPDLNLVTSHIYGPFAGWIPESLSPDQTFPGNFRVLWRETLGYISIWVVDSNLNLSFSRVYGPFFGWDPHADARVVRPGDGSSTASDPAAEAMKPKAGSTPMPQ
jgi:hypothetical protein